MALNERLLGEQFGGWWKIELGKSVRNGGGTHAILDD
jgi:hypothetical protein